MTLKIFSRKFVADKAVVKKLSVKLGAVAAEYLKKKSRNGLFLNGRIAAVENLFISEAEKGLCDLQGLLGVAAQHFPALGEGKAVDLYGRGRLKIFFDLTKHLVGINISRNAYIHIIRVIKGIIAFE